MYAPEGYVLGSKLYTDVFERVLEIFNERPYEMAVFDEKFGPLSVTNLIIADFFRRQKQINVFHPERGTHYVSAMVCEHAIFKDADDEPIVKLSYLDVPSLEIIDFRFRKQVWWFRAWSGRLRFISKCFLRTRLVHATEGSTARILNFQPTGGYLVCKSEDIPSDLDQISDIFYLIRNCELKPSFDDDAIASGIVNMFDEGKRLSREDYRYMFAPKMKHGLWKVIWKDAVSSRPDLAKPGPRNSRKKP